MGANKIGNNGSIQQIGFVALASAASVLFDSPRIKQAHPMACAMEPQRKGMAIGSGGFQALIFLRKRGQGFLLFNQLLGLVKLPSNSSGD